MWSFIAALAGVAGTLIGSLFNAKSTEKTNETNAKINQQNLDYNAAQTQQAWERDDTYYQRSVADAQAAGLSPLAINGAMPNTSPLSAPNPIAMQAPQINTNDLLQSILGSGQLVENTRHNKEEENLRGEEIKNTASEIKLKADSLQLENKKVEEEIKYRANLVSLESKRIAETERANKANESIKEKEYNLNKLSFESKRYYEEIKHQAGGEDVPYRVYDNYQDYLTAREIYLEAFNKFIDDVGYSKYAQADSSSLGVNANVLGTGGGANNTESAYTMKDWTQQNQIAWNKFQKQYPVPVFYNKGN